MLNTISGLLGGGAPAGGDYESIQTITVGAGGATSVTFNSIPSTYSHLQIRVTARSSSSGPQQYLYPQYNGDTGNNYTIHYMQGTGTNAISVAYVPTVGNFAINVPAANINTNIFGVSVIDILDYANTNKFTTMRSLTGHDNNGSGFVDLMSGLWTNTAAITSIKIVGATISQYSSFALYGIK